MPENLATIKGTIVAIKEGTTKKGDPKLGIHIKQHPDLPNDSGVWVNAYPTNQYVTDEFREVLSSLSPGDWGIFHYTDDNFRSLKGIESVKHATLEERTEREQTEMLKGHAKDASIMRQTACKCTAWIEAGHISSGNVFTLQQFEETYERYHNKMRGA